MARKQATLGLNDSFRLMKLLEAEYTARGETDAQFAVYASGVLGVEVNIHHVFNRRSQMGITSNKTIAAPKNKKDKDAMFELVRALEQRVVFLEKAIGMDGKGSKV